MDSPAIVFEKQDSSKEDPYVLDATLYESNPVLVAAVRLVSMSSIPTWRVHAVRLEKYTGEVAPEHVMHRLSKLLFMPKSESSNFNLNTLEPQFVNVSATSDSSAREVEVTFSDTVSPHLKGVDTGIRVCHLRYGQVLNAVLTVTFNTPTEKNERWSPSVATSTRPMPVISLDKELLLENGQPTDLFRGLMSCCPTGVFSPDIEELVDANKCIACRQCEQDYGTSLQVQVTLDESIQRIHMETDGTMTAKALLKSSFLTLAEQLKHVFDE